MSKMKEVAALLGVEIGEKFRVTRADYCSYEKVRDVYEVDDEVVIIP